MNRKVRTSAVLGLFMAVTTAFAGNWPEVPGLHSPYPAGATDLKAPSPKAGDVYFYAFTEVRQRVPAHPIASPASPDMATPLLRLDAPMPSQFSSPLFSVPENSSAK